MLRSSPLRLEKRCVSAVLRCDCGGCQRRTLVGLVMRGLAAAQLQGIRALPSLAGASTVGALRLWPATGRSCWTSWFGVKSRVTTRRSAPGYEIGRRQRMFVSSTMWCLSPDCAEKEPNGDSGVAPLCLFNRRGAERGPQVSVYGELMNLEDPPGITAS